MEDKEQMGEFDLSVVLLHAPMHNKEGAVVTTSLTPIDIHDFARSARTYEVKEVFLAHPSAAMRKLGRLLKSHWEDGFGASYNPNRKDAIENVSLVSDLDEAIHRINLRTGRLPKLIATSAKDGGDRVDFNETRGMLLKDSQQPFLLMFGTGWGMTDELLQRADFFLTPINGPGRYNHLSVRSACAIALDRLLGKR